MSTPEIPFPYGKGTPYQGLFLKIHPYVCIFTFSSSSVLHMRVPKKLIYMIYDE